MASLEDDRVLASSDEKQLNLTQNVDQTQDLNRRQVYSTHKNQDLMSLTQNETATKAILEAGGRPPRANL